MSFVSSFKLRPLAPFLALLSLTAVAESHTIAITNVSVDTGTGGYTGDYPYSHCYKSGGAVAGTNHTSEFDLDAGASETVNFATSLGDSCSGSYDITYTYTAVWTPNPSDPSDIPSNPSYDGFANAANVESRIQAKVTATVEGTTQIAPGGTILGGYTGTLGAILESNGVDYQATAYAPYTSGSALTASVTVQTATGTWDGLTTDGVTIQNPWVLQPDGTYVTTFSYSDQLTNNGDSGGIGYSGTSGKLGFTVQYNLKKQVTVTQVADVTFTPWQ